MTKSNWDEGHIPIIDVHSTKKHDVLREYLHRYVTIGNHKRVRSQHLTDKFLILITVTKWLTKIIDAA